MAFKDDIEVEIDVWASRSATAAKVDSSDKTSAATYAAQHVQDILGSDITDGSLDPVALKIGFLVALDWLRTFSNFTVTADDMRMLERMDPLIEKEMKRRKQANQLPHQKKVNDTEINGLFPYRTQP